MAIIVEFKRLQILNIAKNLPKRMQKSKVQYALRTTINADQNTRNTQYKPLVRKILNILFNSTILGYSYFNEFLVRYQAMMHDLVYK